MVKQKFHRTIRFLRHDVWRIRATQLPGQQSFWLKQLRIILLAIRGFDEDKCLLRASSLTYYTLLSIVPLMAMAFGVAKGFGLEKLLEAQLLEKMSGQETVITQIIDFSRRMLENTKGGLVAGIGVGVLFWTVIRVLGNIEKSFNEIWGVKRGRSLGRKFNDYLSIMLICPLLFIMASSITVLITSKVTLITERVALLGVFSSLIFALLKLLPYAVQWFLFTFIYIFMPNTRIKVTSGLFGGVIGGTIYQIVQWVYIAFQIGASKYGAIYGSFAALPLFLIWLQTSWLIVLFGAELSFAKQNVDTYEFEPDALRASRAFRRLLALRVTHVCVGQFLKGESPMTAGAITHELQAPIRLVEDLLFELTEAGILVEVKLSDVQTAYQPARDPDQFTIHQVLRTLDQKGVEEVPLIETPAVQRLRESLRAFDRIVAESPENLKLRDIPA